MKKHIVLEDLKDSERLVSSQAVITEGLLFTGGISSRDLSTNRIRGKTFEEQCGYAFQTLRKILLTV